MRTGDIMTSPVVTVTPDTSLKEVAALLVERQINAVPVVDAGGRLCGIVSEADLLALEAAPGGAGARGGRVGPPHTAGEVMSRSVYTLTEGTDAAAARMMLRHNLKSVPVVAGDRVVGIVARRDLLRLVARGDDLLDDSAPATAGAATTPTHPDPPDDIPRRVPARPRRGAAQPGRGLRPGRRHRAEPARRPRRDGEGRPLRRADRHRPRRDQVEPGHRRHHHRPGRRGRPRGRRERLTRSSWCRRPRPSV
jgi:CBS domain-containing protein